MILHLTILIATLLLFYSRTFKYSYIIDDVELVKPKAEETKHMVKRVWEHLRGKKYTDSRLAHMVTTYLHILNCVLVYFAFGHNQISFLAALLFGLNPVTNAAAVWISGKPYAYSTTLLLLGCIFLPLLPFAYAFCMYWTSNTLLFPLIFLVKKPHWYLLLLPMVGYLASRPFRGALKSRIVGCSDEMVKIHPKKIILVFKTLGYYFRHCLFPLRIGMCHAYLHTFGLTEKETAIWYKIDKYFWLGISLTIAGGFCLFNSQLPIAYGLLWFLFLTVQWCNFIMVNHPITERYIYLPTIGLMYALANLISNTPLIYVFLTFYAVRLYYFLPAYTDMKSFWKSNTENFPSVAMGFNQYGLGLVQYGNTGSAIDTLIQGVQLRPHDFRLNYNLANIMLATGNTQQAVGFLKTAEVNLEKKNNYQFWIDQISNLKAEIKKRGIDYEHSVLTAPAGSQA